MPNATMRHHSDELIDALAEIKRLKNTVQAIRDEMDRLDSLNRSAIQAMESKHRKEVSRLEDTIVEMRRRMEGSGK